VNLVRDVLDKKLVDREECNMGRVSGLLMHVGETAQPRITHILIGGPTPWSRLHPALGRLVSALSRRWGPRRTGPVKIPWSRVETVGRELKLDVEAKETGALDWEIWLARHVIERIPGGGSEEEE
jgi:sporulation protein YlmC with PRC-barrel domain